MLAVTLTALQATTAIAARTSKTLITNGVSTTCTSYMQPRFEGWSWQTIFCEPYPEDKATGITDIETIRETFRIGYTACFGRSSLPFNELPLPELDKSKPGCWPRQWEVADKYAESLLIVPTGTSPEQLWCPETFAVPGTEMQRAHFWSAIDEQ